MANEPELEDEDLVVPQNNTEESNELSKQLGNAEEESTSQDDVDKSLPSTPLTEDVEAELIEQPPEPIQTISTEPDLLGQKYVLSQTNTEIYVSQPPDQIPQSTSSSSHGLPSKADQLVILLTNSLGLASVNNLELADEYCRRFNCPVVVPDLFDHDPITTPGAAVPERPPSTSTLLEQVKVQMVGAVKGFLDEMWLAKHTFERTYPLLSATVDEIIGVFSPKKVGIIGYSFGGRYVFQFLEGKEEDGEWSSDEDLITVGAAVHPSLLHKDDFKSIKKPLFMVSATNDELLSQSLIKNGVQLMQQGVEFDQLVFDNSDATLPHGFAVPGDYSESEVGEKPQIVIDAVSSWILKHLTLDDD